MTRNKILTKILTLTLLGVFLVVPFSAVYGVQGNNGNGNPNPKGDFGTMTPPLPAGIVIETFSVNSPVRDGVYTQFYVLVSGIPEEAVEDWSYSMDFGDGNTVTYNFDLADVYGVDQVEAWISHLYGGVGTYQTMLRVYNPSGEQVAEAGPLEAEVIWDTQVKTFSVGSPVLNGMHAQFFGHITGIPEDTVEDWSYSLETGDGNTLTFNFDEFEAWDDESEIGISYLFPGIGTYPGNMLKIYNPDGELVAEAGPLEVEVVSSGFEIIKMYYKSGYAGAFNYMDIRGLNPYRDYAIHFSGGGSEADAVVEKTYSVQDFKRFKFIIPDITSGDYDVTVRYVGEESVALNYHINGPRLYMLYPRDKGMPGDTLGVTAVGFGSSPRILFRGAGGDTDLTCSKVTNWKYNCIVPVLDPGDYNVVVVTNAGESNTKKFTIGGEELKMPEVTHIRTYKVRDGRLGEMTFLGVMGHNLKNAQVSVVGFAGNLQVKTRWRDLYIGSYLSPKLDPGVYTLEVVGNPHGTVTKEFTVR
ncbi:hypothetical protein HQ544_04050 [Candidatus Falkowbacteria bacterium]|nr:hypothetical protein [Candidatus Falkowbacteria bacterium]